MGDPDAVAVLTGTQRPCLPARHPPPGCLGSVAISWICLLANKLLGRKLGEEGPLNLKGLGRGAVTSSTGCERRGSAVPRRSPPRCLLIRRLGSRYLLCQEPRSLLQRSPSPLCPLLILYLIQKKAKFVSVSPNLV